MIRRRTRQRDIILRILEKTRSHPTADVIYEQAKKHMPNISKGTVYRNLKVLQEEGRVCELDLDGIVSRYEAKLEPHYHFRCEQCGRVIDVDEPVRKELDRAVERRTGLKVLYHQLEFRGLCNYCR